jgi:hypothetical protein
LLRKTARGGIVVTPTVHYERVRFDDLARNAATESMIAHLERLGEEALAVAAEMDIERDEVSAEWLTARFSRAPLTVQRRRRPVHSYPQT